MFRAFWPSVFGLQAWLALSPLALPLERSVQVRHSLPCPSSFPRLLSGLNIAANLLWRPQWQEHGCESLCLSLTPGQSTALASHLLRFENWLQCPLTLLSMWQLCDSVVCGLHFFSIFSCPKGKTSLIQCKGVNVQGKTLLVKIQTHKSYLHFFPSNPLALLPVETAIVILSYWKLSGELVYVFSVAGPMLHWMVQITVHWSFTLYLFFIPIVVSVQVHVWIIHSLLREQIRLFAATFTVCKSILSIRFSVCFGVHSSCIMRTFLLRKFWPVVRSFPKWGTSAYTPRKAVLVDHSLHLYRHCSWTCCLCE